MWPQADVNLAAAVSGIDVPKAVAKFRGESLNLVAVAKLTEPLNLAGKSLKWSSRFGVPTNYVIIIPRYLDRLLIDNSYN